MTPYPIAHERVEAPDGESWTDFHIVQLPEGASPAHFIQTRFPPEMNGNAETYAADFAVFPQGDQMVVRQKTELHL